MMKNYIYEKQMDNGPNEQMVKTCCCHLQK